MFKTVIDRNNTNISYFSFLDIPTILLAILIRSEAHEYALVKILRRIQTVTGVQLDIPELLSVERKERREIRGKESFRPDTRAIRDTTAHAKFVISHNRTGDFVINFRNDEDGYSFRRVYTRGAILNYYQDYHRVTLIITRLFTLRSVCSFLNMHYVNAQ